MHWAYILYLVLCVLQLPALLALLAAGWHAEKEFLAPRTDLFVDNNATTAAMVVFQSTRYGMDPELLCTAVVAGAYSVMFMMLSTVLASPGDEDGAAWLMQPDAGPSSSSASVDSSSSDEVLSAQRTVQCIRVLFWIFVGVQGLALTAAAMAPPIVGLAPDMTSPLLLVQCNVFLMAALRAASLFGLCRTAPWERGTLAQLWAAGGYLWWLGACANPWLFAARRWTVTLLWFVQVLGLDAVLLIGHQYDLMPSMHVVLHCRLCCIALSACLALLLLLALGASAA